MADDRRTRPTQRPSSHGEDPPPMQRPASRPEPPPLPIAVQAKQAPPSGEFDPQLEILKALARLDQQHAKLDDKIKEHVREILIKEGPAAPAPPSPPRAPMSLPPDAKKHWAKPDSSWFAHLPSTLMAVAALVGVVAQSCSTSQKQVAEFAKKIEAIETKVDTHVTLHESEKLKAARDDKQRDQTLYHYQLSERSYVAGVFERLSVKVDDPPDTPPRSSLEFYPPPLRGSKAPQIQPKATFPAPPPPVPEP